MFHLLYEREENEEDNVQNMDKCCTEIYDEDNLKKKLAEVVEEQVEREMEYLNLITFLHHKNEEATKEIRKQLKENSLIRQLNSSLHKKVSEMDNQISELEDKIQGGRCKIKELQIEDKSTRVKPFAKEPHCNNSGNLMVTEKISLVDENKSNIDYRSVDDEFNEDVAQALMPCHNRATRQHQHRGNKDCKEFVSDNHEIAKFKYGGSFYVTDKKSEKAGKRMDIEVSKLKAKKWAERKKILYDKIRLTESNIQKDSSFSTNVGKDGSHRETTIDSQGPQRLINQNLPSSKEIFLDNCEILEKSSLKETTKDRKAVQRRQKKSSLLIINLDREARIKFCDKKNIKFKRKDIDTSFKFRKLMFATITSSR